MSAVQLLRTSGCEAFSASPARAGLPATGSGALGCTAIPSIQSQLPEASETMPDITPQDLSGHAR